MPPNVERQIPVKEDGSNASGLNAIMGIPNYSTQLIHGRVSPRKAKDSHYKGTPPLHPRKKVCARAKIKVHYRKGPTN